VRDAEREQEEGKRRDGGLIEAAQGALMLGAEQQSPGEAGAAKR